MTNQSPAEGLRQQIETKVSKWFGEPVLAVEDEIMELVTAYAATVEREGRIDELEKVLPESAKSAGLPDDAKMGQLRSIDIGDYITDRLAALQGPPDEAEDTK